MSTDFEESNKNSVEETEEFGGSLIGFTAITLQEIFEAYKKHANVLGFGVRQSTTRYTQGTERKIRSKEYVCAKEGFRCSRTLKSTPPPPTKKKRKPRQLPMSMLLLTIMN